MQEMTFTLSDEYIELTKLLKATRICMSGGEAGVRVEAGEVRVNGEVESRKRRKCRPGDRIEIDDTVITVS